MFDQKLIRVLTKYVGIILILAAAIIFIAGFFVAASQGGSAPAEKVGYFIGYEVGGLTTIAFFYIIVALLSRWNDKL